jgi:hypothetical protein
MSTAIPHLTDLTPEPDDSTAFSDPPEPSTPSVIKRNGDGTVADSRAAAALVRARWATEQAVRDDLTALFDTIEMSEGLQLLAHMREMCELAARAIEKRRTAETDATACCICGITRVQLGNRNWRMVRPRRDTKTMTLYTDYFCSDACVIEENRQKHGIAAMSDRGMQGNPKSSIMAHQRSVQEEAAKLEKPRQQQKTAKLAKELEKKGQ